VNKAEISQQPTQQQRQFSVFNYWLDVFSISVFASLHQMLLAG